MENLTVVELKKQCKLLNIKLTKTNGSPKLKKDLIQSLIQASKVGGRKRHSRKRSKKLTSRRKRRSRKISKKRTSRRKPRSRNRSKKKQVGGMDRTQSRRAGDGLSENDSESDGENESIATAVTDASSDLLVILNQFQEENTSTSSQSKSSSPLVEKGVEQNIQLLLQNWDQLADKQYEVSELHKSLKQIEDKYTECTSENLKLQQIQSNLRDSLKKHVSSLKERLSNSATNPTNLAAFERLSKGQKYQQPNKPTKSN